MGLVVPLNSSKWALGHDVPLPDRNSMTLQEPGKYSIFHALTEIRGTFFGVSDFYIGLPYLGKLPCVCDLEFCITV